MNSIIILLGLLLWIIVYSLYLDNESSKKEKAENDSLKDSLKDRLKQETLKPRYRVVFMVNNIQKFTLPVEPEIFSYHHGVLMSSKEAANKLMEGSYQRGFFKDSDGTTYPACNITAARIEEGV